MHRLWHAALLGVTLLGAAGLFIVVLAPLLFDVRPAGLERARPVALGVAAAAVVLLLAEWLIVHARSL